MKIAHVNFAKGFRGGERQTALLIRELEAANAGKQVLLCRWDSPLREELQDLKNLTFVNSSNIFSGHFAFKGADIIHAHEAKGAHWAFLEHQIRKIPYLITRRVTNLLRNNFHTHAVYRNSHCVVALSRAIKNNLIQYNRALSTMIIPSAHAKLTVNSASVSEIKRRWANRFIVGHIGALVDHHKGQRYLIEAARYFQNRNPDMLFLFLGSGKDELKLKKMAHDLTNVKFLGFCSNVGDYLAIMDLFVFPSLAEGLGSILLDVMTFKVPIIASNVGGIPDIVIDGQTGLLVPPADSNAIIDAIEMLYNDKTYVRQLAGNASRQMNDYSAAAMANRYLLLYKQILNQ